MKGRQRLGGTGEVSFTDFNLREGVVIIKTDAMFKHHAMTAHRSHTGKSAGEPRC